MGIIFMLTWNEKDPEAACFILIHAPTAYSSLCSMSLPVLGGWSFSV